MAENLVRETNALRETLELVAAKASSRPQPNWVTNVDSGVHHRCLLVDMRQPAYLWRTYCGWKFGLKRYELHDVLGTGAVSICEVCAPAERALSKS